MPRSRSDITYRPTPGLTPDQARDARAHAWRYVFECWEQKKAAGASGGEQSTHEKGGVEHALTWTFAAQKV